MLQTPTVQVAIPGILGGLGPLAHIEFERRLLQRNAQRYPGQDQHHPVWVVVSATNIPDRTLSLAGRAESCVPLLTHYGQVLSRAGADFIVVTCNTAHAFYASVQEALPIPWLHLMELTAVAIHQQFPQAQKIGILATNGTLQTQLYERSLRSRDLIPISLALDSLTQQQVMNAIYHPQWGIKSTGDRIDPLAHQALAIAIDQLRNQGADLVIAGCTEISVALRSLTTNPNPWIDPLQVAAEMTLDFAWGGRSL